MKAKRTRGAGRSRQPSAASLREMPEVDFSHAIQPHRYARLQTGYKNQVFVEPEVFDFFGSAEAVNEALKLLVRAAGLSKRKRSGTTTRAA